MIMIMIIYQLCFASMRFLSEIGELVTQDELRQRKEEELDDYASQVNLLYLLFTCVLVLHEC